MQSHAGSAGQEPKRGSSWTAAGNHKSQHSPGISLDYSEVSSNCSQAPPEPNLLKTEQQVQFFTDLRWGLVAKLSSHYFVRTILCNVLQMRRKWNKKVNHYLIMQNFHLKWINIGAVGKAEAHCSHNTVTTRTPSYHVVSWHQGTYFEGCISVFPPCFHSHTALRKCPK